MRSALHAGATPREIMEVVFQSCVHFGMPGTMAALGTLDAVTVTRTEIKWRASTVPLPAWAAHFVKAVDGQTAALTGEEAKNVLALAQERAARVQSPKPKWFPRGLRPAFGL